jgi:hypothetical protein
MAQEKREVPKEIQNALHKKTEPFIDKMIEAYKKEGIGFSRYSLQEIGIQCAAIGYYESADNPLHAAAPAMYEALKELMYQYKMEVLEHCKRNNILWDTLYALALDSYKKAEAALSAAVPETTNS